MKTGTALGLLVGGAVLLLSVTPPRVSLDANGNPVQSPFAALNPLNWFGQGQGGVNPNSIFGQQQQQLPAPYYGNGAGFQNSNFSPYASPGGYSPYGSPGGYQNAGYSPGGYSPYASPGGYQQAGYSPYYGGGSPGGYSPSGSPGGYQQANYSTAGYSPAGSGGYWV